MLRSFCDLGMAAEWPFFGEGGWLDRDADRMGIGIGIPEFFWWCWVLLSSSM